MNETLPSLRRYDEGEVRRLLQRATQLQHAEPAAPDSWGLTLPQLEAIAREAGIEVAALRRAAEELEAGGGGRSGRLATAVMGAPLVVGLERSLQLEVATSDLERLIPLLQRASGAGQASLVGGTLTWTHQSRSTPRELQVIIVSRDGATRIRIEERYGALAGAVFGGGVGGVGAGVGIGVGVGVGASIGSALMIIGFPAAVLAATYVTARSVYSSLVGRRRATLERLLNSLEDEVVKAN